MGVGRRRGVRRFRRHRPGRNGISPPTAIQLAEDRRAHPGDDLTTNLVRRRGRRGTPDLQRDRVVLHPADRRRQRDHAQRHQPRHGRADPLPRRAPHVVGRLRRRRPVRGRGDRAVGFADHLHAPHPHPRHRDEGHGDVGQATRYRCGTARPTATSRCSTTRGGSTSPRTPNPQIGFGAGGAHFCLGANLARREIKLAFEELHRQVPDIAAVEEPAILRSAFVHGIKRLPVGWTPA